MNTGLSYHEEKDFENMNNEDSSHPEQGEQGELYKWVKASEAKGLIFKKGEVYRRKDRPEVKLNHEQAWRWDPEEIEWLCKLSSPPPEGQDELAKDIKKMAERYIVDMAVSKYEQDFAVGGMFETELKSKYLLIKK